MTSTGKLIALIPARSGSKRVPGKNIRELAGHPLIAYTIQVAKDSGLFGEHIYVSSDSAEYLEIAHKYGAKCILRPDWAAGDETPDRAWIEDSLVTIQARGNRRIKRFFILRPTSPFRNIDMLKQAQKTFKRGFILKAINRAKERPEKMWRAYSGGLYGTEKTATSLIMGGKHMEQSSTFDRPFVTLCVQNGSLEIREIEVPISINSITPFFTQGYEGFDINTEDDWILAEALIERGLATLPEIK